jgi:site-specific recombinase XerD
MRVSNQTGSTLTKVAREHALKHLVSSLRQASMNVKLAHITSRHIERYVSMQKDAGVSDRTLQNRMAHIRGELRSIGREKLADSERLSSSALGISGASRDGTHRALSQAQYGQALELARAMHPGFAACLELQHELGLRMREAIQCGPSLKGWERSLMRGEMVRVVHGTKGGRERDSRANDPQKALQAVQKALQATKQGEGRLIPSQTLQGAARAYGRLCGAAGLTGEHASHALRCMYAQQRFALHLEQLGDRREALAATSLDLGHGDGRGTYVAQVYLR